MALQLAQKPKNESGTVTSRYMPHALLTSFDANACGADCSDDFRNFVCHYRLVIIVKICSMKHAATFRERYFPSMHSKDLVNWEIVSYLYDRLDDKPNYDLKEGTVYGRIPKERTGNIFL